MNKYKFTYNNNFGIYEFICKSCDWLEAMEKFVEHCKLKNHTDIIAINELRGWIMNKNVVQVSQMVCETQEEIDNATK